MPAKRQTAAIDRFEDDVAVLVADGVELRRRRDELDPRAKEGDVVDLATGEVLPVETADLRGQVRSARERAGPRRKGNFDL
jgi:hypothetical protein